MKRLVFSLVLFLGFTINLVAQKIDCTKTPSLPDKSWSVVPTSSNTDAVDLSKTSLKINLIQEGTNLSNSTDKEAKTGLSACVLDYLLENPEFIPSEWKGKNIIFTGTLFKDGNGNMLYKTLVYDGEKWTWGKNYPEYILEKTYRVSL